MYILQQKGSGSIDRYNVSIFPKDKNSFEIDVRNTFANGITTIVNINWVAFGEV
jgi:sarcosine oxidase gamma subunit